MITPSTTPPLRLVSVFINESMFRNFFSLNTGLLHYDIIGIDNRELNQGLPTLYNQVIEQALTSEEDSWLFFVHEDFEIRGGLEAIFNLDPMAIHGTFGVRMQNNAPIGIGQHTCSNKDGSNAVQAGLAAEQPELVQSLDCQSVLLHTSLLRKYPSLRFDEVLRFDLYAEDLCLHAGCQLGLPIYVFPLDFQHYSHGRITERYYTGLAYLKEKYPSDVIPGSCSFVGGRSAEMDKIFKYNIEANRQ